MDELKMMMMEMNMYFYQSPKVVYLFSSWKTETTGEYVVAWLGTFLMALMIEGLNSYRYSMQSETYAKINECLASDTPDDVYKVSCIQRFKIMLIYFISLFFSYMLMMVVMTFNKGLFAACIIGLTMGYFLFGFTRKRGFTKIYNPEVDKCCTQID